MEKNTLSLFDLSGKRALVTGSSRGIGFALANGLAGAGAEILINSRDAKSLGAVAADFAENGASVRALAFDATHEDSAREAIDYAEATFGPIDILINNAGMQHRAPLEDFPLDRFETLMRTNVSSAFITGQAVANHMLKRGAGRIINICSVNSLLARATITPYVTSKGALANLTKGMATEWGPRGINVNGIAPGYFKTELNKALIEDAEFSARLAERTPLGRWGNIEELVGAAVFLSSEAASYVNGHILYVDGGLTVRI